MAWRVLIYEDKHTRLINSDRLLLIDLTKTKSFWEVKLYRIKADDSWRKISLRKFKDKPSAVDYINNFKKITS